MKRKQATIAARSGREKMFKKDTQEAGVKTLTNAKARKIHFTLFSVT